MSENIVMGNLEVQGSSYRTQVYGVRLPQPRTFIGRACPEVSKRGLIAQEIASGRAVCKFTEQFQRKRLNLANASIGGVLTNVRGG